MDGRALLAAQKCDASRNSKQISNTLPMKALGRLWVGAIGVSFFQDETITRPQNEKGRTVLAEENKASIYRTCSVSCSLDLQYGLN